MAVRVKFMIRAEPSPSESKSTVPHMIWMQPLDDDDNERFAFPDKYKSVNHHDSLFTLTPAIDAKRDLAPRWHARIFKVSLPADIAALYIDDSGNPKFMGSMLNVFNEADLLQPPRLVTPSVSSVAVSGQTTAPRSLSSIVKDAVITKFNTKNYINAEAWLNIFESECERLAITQERYWEVIRLFLEESAEKWYITTRLSSNSTAWSFWRESFLENFGTRGLAGARTAFNYRYLSGSSLSDYCQNKLSLLIGFNPRMHELDRIVHVVFGLPQSLQDRINLSEVSTVGKLLSLINTFDKPASTRSIFSSSSSSASSSSSLSSNAFSSLRPRTPCGYCKKKGRDLYHFEKDCLNKIRDNQRKVSNVKQDGPSKAIHSLDLNDLQSEVNDLLKNE